ncbi:MAG TPA: lipopolysaccharide kinase InaA family protein [Gemmataceae bacterium]|jgi:tRNA A-37 threonylcarbamoyl transferase component Bud32|nr:lipopolysaccharide kinase InaA family protein [Gemmataceae bacterium]
MPVEALRLGRGAKRTGNVVLRPDAREWLATHGLERADDFLQMPGVVVSGHVGRNVSRIAIGGRTAYVKREHRIRWRDRYRSWLMGFGWSSMSAREGAVLRRLDKFDLPGPRWLAFGESHGQGFLLVEAAENAVELRSLPEMSTTLAERIGNVAARIHAAGVHQPDLFAKHILVNVDSGQLTILDWQRARHRTRIRLQDRIRSLASLRASIEKGVLDDTAWFHLLGAYLAAAKIDDGSMPPLDLFARQVSSRGEALANRPGMKSQRIRSVAQELIRIEGETVCAIRSVADNLSAPATIKWLYDPRNQGLPIPLSGGRIGMIRIGEHRRLLGRTWAAIRGKNWRAPEVKAARLLFHLERFGIPAPRLLAYGQIVRTLKRARSFVLFETTSTTRPLAQVDREAARLFLGRLHEVGCHLAGPMTADGPLGISGNEVVVSDFSGLCLTRCVTGDQVRRDLARLDTYCAGAR